jgi:hypothetical protein
MKVKNRSSNIRMSQKENHRYKRGFYPEQLLKTPLGKRVASSNPTPNPTLALL